MARVTWGPPVVRTRSSGQTAAPTVGAQTERQRVGGGCERAGAAGGSAQSPRTWCLTSRSGALGKPLRLPDLPGVDDRGRDRQRRAVGILCSRLARPETPSNTWPLSTVTPSATQAATVSTTAARPNAIAHSPATRGTTGIGSSCESAPHWRRIPGLVCLRQLAAESRDAEGPGPQGLLARAGSRGDQ